MLSIIVAMDRNRLIGKDNSLIWHIPEDLKRFKRLTTNHTIIMGRKTFESLGRILPNRKHIVLTKKPTFIIQDKNVEIKTKIEELEKYINSDEEVFVIGGASIYKQLLPYVRKMYITKIQYEFEGDTYFPNFEEADWKIIEKINGIRNENNPYNYEYITYERKNIVKRD